MKKNDKHLVQGSLMVAAGLLLVFIGLGGNGCTCGGRKQDDIPGGDGLCAGERLDFGTGHRQDRSRARLGME